MKTPRFSVSNDTTHSNLGCLYQPKYVFVKSSIFALRKTFSRQNKKRIATTIVVVFRKSQSQKNNLLLHEAESPHN